MSKRSAAEQVKVLEEHLARVYGALAKRDSEVRYLRDRLRRLAFEPGSHERTCALHAVLSNSTADTRRVFHEAGYDAERALARLAEFSDDDVWEIARLDMVRVKYNDPSLTMQSPVVQAYLKRAHPLQGSEWEDREVCPCCDGVGSKKR